MTTAVHQRLADRRASGATCDVQGCDYPQQKLGRYCERHDDTNQRTGHPLGKTIRASSIKPFVKMAKKYLEDNRDHPSIQGTLSWLYHLINDPSRRRLDYLSTRATPNQRLGRWLDKLRDQEVHELDALAVITAMYMTRELYPHDYKSDRHFLHQLVIRFLRLAPAPQQERWSDGKRMYRYDRITSGVRDRLGPLLQCKLSLICIQIARLLNRSIQDKETIC